MTLELDAHIDHMHKMTRILDLPMEKNNFDAETVRDYMKYLLINLWDQGESFSAKRPFGDSGWQYDVYKPMLKAGIIKGSLDEEGYIEDLDTREADNLILQAINII